jgi:glycine/D-amino acid oxidase-like deaminating enzyme
VWVGGEDVYESTWQQSAEEEEKYEEKYAKIITYARDVFGIDASYTRQAAWSGKFYPAVRTLPYIGEIPGMPHIASVGFGGTGIITSYLSGMLIAAWKRGELLEYQKFFSLTT